MLKKAIEADEAKKRKPKKACADKVCAENVGKKRLKRKSGAVAAVKHTA